MHGCWEGCFTDLAFGYFYEFAFFHFEGYPIEYTLFVNICDGAGALADGYEGFGVFEAYFAMWLIEVWGLFWVEGLIVFKVDHWWCCELLDLFHGFWVWFEFYLELIIVWVVFIVYVEWINYILVI